jgi:membrane-bound lytic murein transglycosylase D
LLIYKPLSGSAGPETAAAGDDSAPSKSSKKSKSTKAAKSGSTSTQNTQATYHKVKKGETLSSIAHSYNTTVANLKKNNASAAANLRPGEVLVISK